ncbi:hypothetical protein [Bifidobacterium sp. M0307]|uniref:hypothetical protein n=2 Tax=unclassified Bifidobacterium TaxID=2608897 RepID=UPI0018DE4925|nr:hypothetical protein [Bifidobacterium sp. M0307]MBI0173962.1 hypothetical protein [Bifidobacterium sp. M0307]
MMDYATRLAMTARMQDTINDIREEERGLNPIGWVIQDDTLRVIQPTSMSGPTVRRGLTVDPDTILVLSYTADRETGELSQSESWTFPNPIENDLRGPTDMYANRVLGEALFDLSRRDQRPIDAQGASFSKPVTLADPISGAELPKGWHAATEDTVARRTAMEPDLVRASYLQKALDETPRPFAWAMEEGGKDIHIVAWSDLKSPQGAAYTFTHMQYDDQFGRPILETRAYTEVPERAKPGPMDENRMMDESVRLIHYYQQEVRHPLGTEHPPEPDYIQGGLVRQGQQPQILTPRGTPVPQWDRMIARFTKVTLERATRPTSRDHGTPKKGKTMAEQPQYDEVHGILVVIDNTERLNARIEGYATGLYAAWRDNPQAEVSDEGIEQVAAAIAQDGIEQYRVTEDHQVRPSAEVMAGVTAGVVERMREHMEFLGMVRDSPAKDEPGEKKTQWARVGIPSQYLRPYQMKAKDGRTFEKAIVNMPNGTRVNGVDVSGYALDRFMSDSMRQAKANGRRVTLSFPTDKRIELFKGKGAERKTLQLDNPWELVKGIKASLQPRREEQAARPGQEPASPAQEPAQAPPAQAAPVQEPGPNPSQDGPHELAAYIQADEKTGKAMKSVLGSAARDMAAGNYDRDHAREVVQRITDKAAERYTGPQGPRPGGPAFSKESRAAATEEIMKSVDAGIQARAETPQQAHPAPQRDGEATGRPAAAGKSSFMADLVQRTDSRMQQQAPAMDVQKHAHSKGSR